MNGSKTHSKAGIEKLFRDALLALAIKPEEQVRVTEPGDVPVDIIDDYLLNSELFLEYFNDDLKPEVIAEIKSLRETVDKLPDTVFCETNLLSMQQPEWQLVREQAKKLLNLLGWFCETPSPYLHEGDGVYRRP